MDNGEWGSINRRGTNRGRSSREEDSTSPRSGSPIRWKKRVVHSVSDPRFGRAESENNIRGKIFIVVEGKFNGEGEVRECRREIASHAAKIKREDVKDYLESIADETFKVLEAGKSLISRPEGKNSPELNGRNNGSNGNGLGRTLIMLFFLVLLIAYGFSYLKNRNQSSSS